MVSDRYPSLSGMRFTKLKVIRRNGRSASGGRLWLCYCDCGNKISVKTSALLSGNTKACGCLWKKHGLTDSRVHKSWSGMIQRCTNKRRKDWPDYGGRGIKVCKRWMKFESFLADMGNPPVGMSLDRMNNNGNYKKSNCRWATPTQQARNTRNNRIIAFRGIRKPMASWAEEFGISLGNLHSRLGRGWPIKDALTTPTGHPMGRRLD